MFTILMKKIILFCASVFCISSYTQVFDDAVLHTIIQHAVQLPELDRMSFIFEQLHHIYNTPEKTQFYLFNAGSTFGFVGLLYASLTEYLLIYGGPLVNAGHSGRYVLTIHDFVYRGKITVATTENLEGTEFLPGEFTMMEWGTAHHYALDKNTWMLEHAVGFTPTALPFVLFGLTATADIIGLSQLMFAYGKEVTKNLICCEGFF